MHGVPSILLGEGAAVFTGGASIFKLVPRMFLLHLTARVGLPLLWRPMSEAEFNQTGGPIDNAPEGVFSTPDNRVLSILSTQWNPALDQLRCEEIKAEDYPSQRMMLIRADGKELEALHVDVLCRMITKNLDTNRETFNKEMTPEKFIEYWKTKDVPVECPVSMNCKACGKDAGLRCGKCEIVKYCSKECQQSDWAFHKKVCVKAWGT